MKIHSLCAFAAALCTVLFFSCQIEIENPEPDIPIGFVDHLGRYENYGIYQHTDGYNYKGQMSATLKDQPDGSVELTVSTPVNFFTIKIEPVSEDSATIAKQNIHDERMDRTFTTQGGGLSIRKGVLRGQSNSTFWASFTFCRAERWPRPLVRTDYLGTYSASPEHNEVLKTYTLKIEAGAAANEVVLKNVRDKGLSVPGRISSDTLYTERVPMDTLGNFLAASKSVIRGNVLYLPFVMEGPSYPFYSSSSSAAVKCYNKQ